MDLTKNEIVKCLSASDNWEQLNQAQEDCAALIVSINKLRRNKNRAKNSAGYDAVCDDIAATTIILARLYLVLDSDKISQLTMLRLARSAERLKNGNI